MPIPGPDTPVRLLVAAGLACAVLMVGPASGQEPGGPAAVAKAPPIDPLDITGRTFAGLRWPLSVTPGRIQLRAARGFAWNETEMAANQPPVRRLLLSGDVTARIGLYEFTAQRAAVWIAPLPAGDPDAGPGVYQVFLYLDQAGSPSEAPTTTITGDRLPVQGIIRVEQGLSLRVDGNLAQGPPKDEFLGEAERALAVRLRRLVKPEPRVSPSPDDLLEQGEDVPPLEPGEDNPAQVLSREQERVRELERTLEPAERREPIFSDAGVISFSSGSIVRPQTVAGENEFSLMFNDGLTVQYWDPRQERTYQISAKKGVVFLKQEAAAGQWQFSSRSVKGIYLEGDVIVQDGRYTLRSPRVYYDVEHDRALLIDAVFWTYDAKRGLPLYVRAKTISQESRDTFKATQARLTNTSFAEPDMAIGASTITFTRTKTESGEPRTLVDARDATIRAGGVPVFWWPHLSGDPGAIPLRDFRVENSSGSGAAIKTTWNAYSLIGVKPPEKVSADLILDEYFQRGPAFGTNVRWGGTNYGGEIFGYTIPDDRGTDLLVTGVKKDHEGDFRGILLGEHRVEIDDKWSLFAEGAYISDPTFIDGFFETVGRTHREFTSSLYLRRLHENSVFFAETKANANDFIANEYLLQSPGYTVAKLPDVGYVNLAEDLLKDYPGLLSYSAEARVTRMRLEFPDPEVQELGFTTPFRSQSLFGINPTESIADALRAQGLNQEWVTRFDTRHELTMPLAAGPVNITPFIVGRFTGYDDDFSTYSPDAADPYRFWAAEGVTFSTEMQHVDNTVESRLFDLHRIRHIVSPGVTVWHADSTIDRTDLPVYDDEVESLAEGTATRIGVSQVWQTQRGGPGRWRSVDVFRLDTDLVVSSGDVDRESPIGRYFGYRPEYSNLGGTFADVVAAWQVSDVLSLAAHETYDFDINQSARTSAGIAIRHTPEFSTFAEVLFLNAQNQTYAILGLDYALTKKYDFISTTAYDTNLGEVQNIDVELRRKFPSVILGIGASYNNITSESSIGFVIQPLGTGNQGGRFRGIGSNASSAFGG